jgi:hypothetical protein
MLEVERKTVIDAPISRVAAVLGDLSNLQRLLPRAEHVEVQHATDGRARVTFNVRAGRFGLRRVDGEARMLPTGLRFVAVRPLEIDARWLLRERGAQTEVTAHLGLVPGGFLGSFGRIVPQRFVTGRIGTELDASLRVLAELAKA